MRNIFFIVSLLISLISTSQTIDYAREVVKELSSEEYAGRGYSNEGIIKAANYIKQEFKKNGLQSLNGDYCQPFTIDANTFPGVLSLKIGRNELIAGQDYLIDPSSPVKSGTFEVFTIRIADLLVNEKLKKALKSSKNKVLIIDERAYQTDDKSVKQRLDEIVRFLKYNPDLKHAALIMLTDKKLTWHISPVQTARPVFIVNSDLEIEKGIEVTLKVEAELKNNYETCNIIGFHSGKTEPDSIIVLTAHYDHLGNLGSEAYIPGANDNASGIAMLLTLSKYFQDNSPDYSVVFLATTAEELGLLGAKYFVENSPIDLKRVKFLINFDLAGTGDEGIKVVNGSVFQAEFDRLTSINQVKNYLPAVKKRGEACISDHCAFYMKGVPSFYIYTLGGIKAYHDIYDRYETLPFTEFEDYSKLMIDFIEGF